MTASLLQVTVTIGSINPGIIRSIEPVTPADREVDELNQVTLLYTGWKYHTILKYLEDILESDLIIVIKSCLYKNVSQSHAAPPPHFPFDCNMKCSNFTQSIYYDPNLLTSIEG